jgi:hypothetical protein
LLRCVVDAAGIATDLFEVGDNALERFGGRVVLAVCLDGGVEVLGWDKRACFLTSGNFFVPAGLRV